MVFPDNECSKIRVVENTDTLSDSSSDSDLPDCLNVINGQPNMIDFTLDGSINGVSAVLRLDSGADVSVISKDFIKDSDNVATHRTIHGIDCVDSTVPSYMLPLCAPGVKGKCLFAVHSKLPPGTVLIGRDLGDTFIKLLDRAKVTPKAVNLTRAQSKAREEANSEQELKHAVEGANPISLDSIPDVIPTIDSDISIVSTSNVSEQIEPEMPVPLNHTESVDHSECENLHEPIDPHSVDVPVVHSVDDPVVHSVDGPIIHSVDDSEQIEPAKDLTNNTHSNVSDDSGADQQVVCIPELHFDGITKPMLVNLQHEDKSLSHIWSWDEKCEKRCFVVDGVLMCLTTTNGRMSHSIVLPKQLRLKILKLAHNMSGHFGAGATRALINPYFTWPGLYKDIKNYVKSCVECQKFNKSLPPKAPLVSPEVIVTRFEKLAVDIVGPLEKSKQGYRFLLTAIDLATGFPFAYPMRGFTAEETAQNLLSIFSIIGPPVAVLSDQGRNFLSRVLSFLYSKFGVMRIKTSPYHPESNGKLERFHATLKTVIRKTVEKNLIGPRCLIWLCISYAIFRTQDMVIHHMSSHF